MKTIHRYIAWDFLATFLAALVVLCFVMSVGLMFKAVDYIAKGASFSLVVRFLWSGFPGTLSLSIPIAALVSALLVFGRLSSDSEISAMRACGIRIFDIMRMPLLIAVLLSCVCLYLNGTVSPSSAAARKRIRKEVGTADILAVLQPGVFVDVFQGYRIFFGKRTGMQLEDVWILEYSKTGSVRDIKAKTANVEAVGEKAVRFELEKVTIDPVQDGKPGIGHADRIVRLIGELPSDADSKAIRLRIKDYQSSDLIADILAFTPEFSKKIATRIRRNKFVSPAIVLADGKDDMPEYVEHLDPDLKMITQMKTELCGRLVMALACVCFVAIGVPLGMKTHRKESAVGIGICLGIAAGFYLFMIAADSLSKYPALHPYLISWIPVIACAVIFGITLHRNP